MSDDQYDGLVDDVVTMTRQASVDGLPLSSVLEDLRLVLDLASTDEVPAQILRTCALAWAEVQQELAAGPGGVATRTWHELESHLWSLVGSRDEPQPGWVIVVRAGTPDPSGAGDVASRLASVLTPADHLCGAAQVLAAHLGLPGEQVSMIREPSGQEPDCVVALVAAAATASEDRLAQACAKLSSLPGGEGAGLVVRVHSLSGHADGMLSALRAALGQPG